MSTHGTSGVAERSRRASGAGNTAGTKSTSRSVAATKALATPAANTSVQASQQRSVLFDLQQPIHDSRGRSVNADFQTPGNLPHTGSEARRVSAAWNSLRDVFTPWLQRYADRLKGMDKDDPRYKATQRLRDDVHEGTAITTHNELRAGGLFGPLHDRLLTEYVEGQQRYQALLVKIQRDESALSTAGAAHSSPTTPRARSSAAIPKAAAPKTSGTGTTRTPRAPSPATRARQLNDDVTRAVNSPQDAQHFHRAYTALHEYLDSLTPAQRTKAEAALTTSTTPRTRTPRAKKSA